jgi:hypothetical protein
MDDSRLNEVGSDGRTEATDEFRGNGVIRHLL